MSEKESSTLSFIIYQRLFHQKYPIKDSYYDEKDPIVNLAIESNSLAEYKIKSDMVLLGEDEDKYSSEFLRAIEKLFGMQYGKE